MMMNKRSLAWRKRKANLDLKEQKIREDLEVVTGSLQSRAKTVAKISLITGGVFLAGYGLYKILKPTTKVEYIPTSSAPKQAASATPHKQSHFSFKTLILERLALVVIKFIGNQLTEVMNNKFGVDSEREDADD